MKLRSLVLALALVGCAKSNDIEPMQQEATLLATHYNAQIDALDRRAQELEQHIVKTRTHPNVGEAVRMFNEARAKIAELRGMSQKAPGAIAMASGGAKLPAATGSAGSAEKAPEPDPKWKLERLLDEMRERFTDGIVEANSRLDGVESWLNEADRYVAPTQPVASGDEQPAPEATR